MGGVLAERTRFWILAASSLPAMAGFGLLLDGLLYNRAFNAAVGTALLAAALALTSYARFGGRSGAAPR